MSSIVKSGVDYSSGWPGGAALAAAGHSFACRYMGQDSRCLTQPELDDLVAHDIQVVAIGEYDSIVNGSQISAMFGGAENGHRDASFAHQCLLDLSLPETMPIYFTLDVEPGSVPWNLVYSYLQAAATTLGGVQRVGLYAGYEGVKWAKENNMATWLWQTYAWSQGLFYEPNHLYQYDIYGEYVGPIDVDLNKAFKENYGQASWFSNTVPVPQYPPAMHPDWLPTALAQRYPAVGKWTWNGQKLTLHPIRHNVIADRNSNQYAEPTTGSAHVGDLILEGTKIPVEYVTDVKQINAEGNEETRQWMLTGWGSWVPATVGNYEFIIRERD